MIVDNGTAKARSIADRLRSGLDDRWKADPNTIIVVGGDGFLLDSIKQHGLVDRLYVPINGGTLGFLLNDIDSADLIGEINNEDWNISEFATLGAEIVTEDNKLFFDTAVNEVCIERMSSQTTRLDVVVDRAEVATDLAADGLIIATSLGSTGYNFSAGGAICHAGLKVRIITPICPHHPRLPPFVVPTDSPVRIRANQRDKRPIKATVDGREYKNVKHLTVSDNGLLKMAYFRGHNFTHQLVNKILRR